MEGRYGWLLRLTFRLLFSRVRPVPEQVHRVRELAREGTVVYVLRSRSDLESLLYHYQCARNGLPLPVFASDGFMTPFQSLGFLWRRVKARFSAAWRDRGLRDPYRSGFLQHLVRNGSSVILYLEDMEAFTRRFLKLGRDPFVQILEVQAGQERPIFMVPQMIIWDRARERWTPRLDEVLLGQRAHPSDVRVLFNFLRFFSKESKIFQAEPLALPGFLAAHAGSPPQEVALALREELLERLSRERRLVTGPVVRSRQEIMERVLFDERVQQAMARRVKRGGKSEEAVRREAYELLREIATDFHPGFLRLWEKILTWAFRHLFEGLEVDKAGLERVREAGRSANLVIVPCHKSHMDYLLLAYIFYRDFLFPPFTAAGLNLAFWPMGYLFRKSGAFFIRRDFRGSILYPAIFSRYLHVLLAEGYPLEFFIEGGRSRSGKLILPKLGLLSLLIDGYRAGACKDIAFVPVAIAYERVMEEGAYLREVEGGEKRKESFWEILRSGDVIRRRYGKIWVTFDEPVSLRAFLGRTLENPHPPVRYTRQNIADYLGYELAHRINAVMTVVPTALAAAAILSASPRGFSYREILRLTRDFYGVLRDEGARLSGSLANGDQLPAVLRDTLDGFQKEGLVSRVPVGQETPAGEDEEDLLYNIQDRDRRQLDYYKNSILHYFLPCAFVSASLLSADRPVVGLDRVMQDTAFLRDFFQQEFVFLPGEDLESRIRETLKGMVSRGLIWEASDGFSVPTGRRPDLLGFARMIQSYFESYYVVGSTLKHISQRRLSHRVFLWRVRFTGHRLLQTRKIQLPESLSQVNYANAIDHLIRERIIQRQVDKAIREETYYSLSRERREIHWGKLKRFLRVYG
jgi:glycerol-3-phosphate O-acyltransferase